MINSVGVLMSPWLNNKIVPSFEMPEEVFHGKMTRDPTALKHPNMGSVSVNGTGREKMVWSWIVGLSRFAVLCIWEFGNFFI